MKTLLLKIVLLMLFGAFIYCVINNYLILAIIILLISFNIKYFIELDLKGLISYMEKKNEQNLDNTQNSKLDISDIISRLSKLETYYMEIIDRSDLDGPEVKGRKTQFGSWIKLDDITNLIEELKTNLNNNKS